MTAVRDPGATQMLTVFLFDRRQSRRVEDWRAALAGLADDQLLWLALREPTEKDVGALQETLDLHDDEADRLLEPAGRACVADAGERLHMTLYPAGDCRNQPVLAPVQCVLGPNWVVTAHHDELDVLEEFRERAEGGGQVGGLDAPTFAAALFEWVIASYFRAFEALETQLDDFDGRVMASTPRNVSTELARLVELRRSVGVLQRGLSLHREIVAALIHPELDLLSTKVSAERFASLESRVNQALEAARDTRESIFGSFDLLVAKNGQRTNEIVKVLTLATVVLLPAALLAGIMGMNFKVGFFNQAWMFWAVIAAMLGIAVLVLSVARSRRWI